MRKQVSVVITDKNSKASKMQWQDYRADEFLKALGRGKNVYQLESENDEIDEQLEKAETKKRKKKEKI